MIVHAAYQPPRQRRRKVPTVLLTCKVLVVLLLTTIQAVAIDGLSQTVTLNENKVSIDKVFGRIKQQTGYSFWYDERLLQKANLVTITVKDMPLEKALDLLFKNQPLSFEIVGKVIVVKGKEVKAIATSLATAPSDSASRKTVSGRVLDTAGSPLRGATVRVKGGSQSTLTNEGGYFSLNDVKEGAFLQVSFVGYEAAVLKAGDGLVVVKLRVSAAELDAVVTTAYGVERKEKEVGYSVARISGEEITQTHPVNLLNGLAGKVSSLNISTTSMNVVPNGTDKMSVLLRGVRTFSSYGSNTPLFVIDGTIISAGSETSIGVGSLVINLLNSINPNDIDNVTILKGANATTAYGPEGVNGVIIINTKRGSSGKTSVGFNHTTSIQSINRRYPKLQTKFGSGSVKNAFGDGIYDPVSNLSWGSQFTDADSTIGRRDEMGNVQRSPYHYTNERFSFFRNALTVQDDISLSGGDSRSHFFVGIQYAYVQGIIPGDESKRTVFRSNAGRLFGKLKASINLSFTRNLNETTQASIYSDLVNTPANIPLTKFKDYSDIGWSDHNHYYNDYFPNPYEDAAIKRYEQTEYAFIGNFSLSGKIFKWLSFINRVGGNYSNNNYSGATNAIYYSDFALTNGRVISSTNKNPRLSESINNMYGLNNDFLISIEKEIYNFSIKATFGNTIRESFFKDLSISAVDLANPAVFNVGFIRGNPFFGGRLVKTRSTSFFSNLTFGLRNFFFLELAGRDDKESRLNNGSNDQFYYGVNSSLILTDAIPALTRISFLSKAKVRAAWNKTASFSYLAYSGERIFSNSTGFPFANLASFAINPRFTSRDIKPEKIFSQEYGMTCQLLKNRISLDVTFYSQLNNGVILDNILISDASGYTSTALNAGKFRNEGWEFDLKASPLFRFFNDFVLNVNCNLAINDNKIISLYKGQRSLNLGLTTGTVGLPAFSYRVVDWTRDSLGRVIVNGVTGLPSLNPTPITLGRTLPKYTAGLSLNIAWKEVINLAVTVEYRGGNHKLNINDVANANIDVLGITQVSAINGRQRFVFPNSVYWDGLKFVENKDIVVNSAHSDFLGSYSYMLGATSNFYSSAAFWKVRDVVLSYEFPLRKWFKGDNYTIKKVSLALFARNLFSFYSRTNLWGDPELNTTNFESRFYGFNLNVSL